MSATGEWEGKGAAMASCRVGQQLQVAVVRAAPSCRCSSGRGRAGACSGAAAVQVAGAAGSKQGCALLCRLVVRCSGGVRRTLVSTCLLFCLYRQQKWTR